MANTIATPIMILREASRILHGKLSFLSNVKREYDDQYAKSGAKIGTYLNVRMPSMYTVRTGATFAAQDHTERSTPLYVTSQVGVDVSFTSVELTMSLDYISDRVLKPAMTKLAAYIENDCLARAYKKVANYTGTTSTQLTYKQFQQGGQYITENLGPGDTRTALLNPASMVEFNDAVKGLFNAQSNLAAQYREGMMGRTGGFDVFENTFMPQHTRGSLAGTVLTTGTALGTSTTTANTWVSTTDIDIDGATSGTTVKAGDILTFSGLYDVHPETKVNTGRLKRFVVQDDETVVTAGTATVTVMPGMIYGVGNAFQNCVISGPSNSDGLTVTAFGVASTAYGQNLQFHKDAFMFATADLINPDDAGCWGARETMDGISMRLIKQYQISSDTMPYRFDILYGFNSLYPELAVRGFHALT